MNPALASSSRARDERTPVLQNTGAWMPIVNLSLFNLGQNLALHYGLVRWFLPILVLVAVAVIFYLLGRRSRVVRAEPAATAPPPAEQNPPQS